MKRNRLVVRERVQLAAPNVLAQRNTNLTAIDSISGTGGQINSTRSLAGCGAVVTGASSGIGRAIALTLSRYGVELCLVGRNASTLEETVRSARRFSKVASFRVDLTVEDSLEPLFRHLEGVGRLDILVHSAGVIHQNLMKCACIQDFDLQYATNVRVPYMVTQRLLPLLEKANGQIVFINSSAGVFVRRPEVGQYGATKHALKAIADGLREEVNPKGIRVLSVFLGRTATPMQEALHRQEHKVYRPERLLQPEDVASIIVQALVLPRTAEVTDIYVRPMLKN